MPSTPATMPTVAAIIPTRDRPSLGPGAVRSALAQPYPTVEVWVTDDGSDPPVELPQDLAGHRRVHLLRLERPRGSSVARNEAISACSADYLAFLDDDDVW